MTNIAVLLKVVPDLEGIRYDPERKTLIRQGVNLFLNPFDGRALRVALDLRRSGDSVTAISMGPPAAERVLREALDLGADRALLITDRLLAGSDTLVTARTLIRSIQLAAAELILCGRNSTDSDTGQVGPQVAGMLGIPFLSSARRIDRMDGEPTLEVVSDTEAGWARYRCTPPAVVSVDEKIAKIRKPTPEELAAASPRKVEILTATQLGLDPSVLGLAGSPTVVGELVNEEPGRNPQIFIEGTPEERVRAAATALGERLSRGPPTPPPAPPLVEPLDDAREVLVHVTDEEGELQAAALPILTGVRRLGRGFWPSAIWVGPPPSESALQAIAAAGGRVVRHLGNTPGPMLPRRVAIGITAALESRPAAAGVAFLATLYGRSVAGQVSARADLGLVGDAVGIDASSQGELIWRKPAFGGGLVAAISCRTRPSLATVRPGAIPPGRANDVPSRPLTVQPILSGLPAPTVRRVETGTDAVDPEFGSLDEARVVVSVGMGLGGPERVREVIPMLRGWKAALAATRRVVDAGWVPRQLQVGLTGRSLAPELVLIIGASGAPNHMVGWRRARLIVGINPRADAPLFRGVDVGIVASWDDVRPSLEEALEPTLRKVGLVTG